jgi:hypothetical protein
MMSISYAASVPAPIDAGNLEYGKSYSFSLPFTNTEDYSQTILLSFTPRSKYLEPYTVLSPNKFTLSPGETRIISATIIVPENMPPGKHALTILPEESINGEGVYTLASRVAEITFYLPGEISESAELKKIAIINRSDGWQFDLTIKNTGNVRIGAFPSVEIRKYYGSTDIAIKTIRGSTQYLIEPQEEKVLSVSYFDPLEKGEYRAIGKCFYSNGSTNNLFATFTSTQSITANKPGANSGSGSSGSGAGSSSSNGFPLINIGNGSFISDRSIAQASTNASNSSAQKPNPIELRITQLETNVVSYGAVSIILGIENVYESRTAYNARITVFNQEGELIEEFNRSGEVGGLSTEKIEFPSEKLIEGNYKLEAIVEYSNKTAEKLYLATIAFPKGDGIKNIIIDYSSLTGKFTRGLSENKTTVILFMLVLLLAIIYFRGGVRPGIK